MKKISLNFKIARQESYDRLLRSIAKESLSSLFKRVDKSAVKGILLTGSVANGEGTVIKEGSSTIASDFDFVVYMSLARFLKNRTRLQALSQELTAGLVRSGINTHVNFTPSTDILRAMFRFTDLGIYEYEFAHASKTLFGKSPVFDRAARPSKKDALELAFTVVNELFFSDVRDLSEIEETYVYAKRALTLLNSLLIFHGIYAETYQERMEMAQKYAATTEIQISENELNMLQVFTEYKLSGCFQALLDALNCKKIGEVVRIQRNFLQEFATKTVRHELMNFVSQFSGHLSVHGDSEKGSAELLSDYFRLSEASLFQRFLGITLFILWTFSRDTKRKEIFSAYLFYRQSPKTILNTIVTLLFLRRDRIQTGKVLKEVFPWINFNEAAAVEKLFSLWQIAEQSIKFA